jgi:hypothetical protein
MRRPIMADEMDKAAVAVIRENDELANIPAGGKLNQ